MAMTLFKSYSQIPRAQSLTNMALRQTGYNTERDFLLTFLLHFCYISFTFLLHFFNIFYELFLKECQEKDGSLDNYTLIINQ